MTGDTRSGADRDFERRARACFDASAEGIDASARSRLNRSRQRALEIAAGKPSFAGTWRAGALAGAMAASVFVAALLWRVADEPGHAPLDATVVADEAPSQSLEVLAANEEDLRLAAAEEDLDFYAWVEAAAAAPGPGES